MPLTQTAVTQACLTQNGHICADPMDRKEFAQLVGEAQRVSGAGKGLTNAEVELLFKVG